MTISFAEAVARSEQYIQSGLQNEIAPSRGNKFMLFSYPPSWRGVPMLRDESDKLLAWAEQSAVGFKALRFGIAKALEDGDELPAEVLQWLILHLRDEVTRPDARAGRHDALWLHLLIWVSVGNCVDWGMNATRNDTSPPTSACDAVAEALENLGLTPTTFQGVKRIWLEFEKRKRGAKQAI